MPHTVRTSSALFVIAGLLVAAPRIDAQWDEQVVLSLPVGGVSGIDAERSAGGLDWLLVSGAGGTPLSDLFFRPGGPGTYSFQQSVPGTAGDLSPDGQYAAVGDTLGQGLGGVPSVHLLVNVGGVFQPAAVPVLQHPSDPSPLTEFGAAVALAGDMLVVGAPGISTAFFYRDLSPPLGQWGSCGSYSFNFNDRTGHAVAAGELSTGDVLMVIGAPLAGPLAPGGNIAIWSHSPGGVCSVVSIKTAGTLGAEYGSSLDLDGPTLLVGAPGFPDIGGVADLGMVQAFNWNGTNFIGAANLFGDRVGDRFGESVVVQGDRGAGGSPGYDGYTDGFPDPGAIVDRGGVTHLRDAGAAVWTKPAGRPWYTLEDLGGGAPPHTYELHSGYDGYDRLFVMYAEDAAGGYVVEARASRVSWLWDDLGRGTSGWAGVPKLIGEGSAWSGDQFRTSLFDAAPNATSYFIFGVTALNLPFKGGTLIPAFGPPNGLFVALTTDPLGRLIVQVPTPAGLPSGTSLIVQHVTVDPVNATGLTLSNGVQVTVP